MAQDTPSRELDKVVVRLPDGMRDRLKVAAARKNRSVNAEIVSALQMIFPPDPPIEDLVAVLKEAIISFESKDNPENRNALMAAVTELYDHYYSARLDENGEIMMTASRAESYEAGRNFGGNSVGYPGSRNNSNEK